MLHKPLEMADNRTVKSRLHLGIVFAAVVAMTFSLVAPDAMAPVILRSLVSLVAVSVIWMALKRRHPRRRTIDRLLTPDPWWVFGAGLLLATLGDIAIFLDGTILNWAGQALKLAGFGMNGWALAQMMRSRFGDRSRDHVAEAIIAAATFSLLSWVTMVEPMLHRNGLALTSGIAGIVPITFAFALASGALFLRHSFETKPSALSFLALSQVIGVVGAELSFVSQISDHAIAGALAAALLPIYAATLALSAYNPSMAVYEDPAGPAGARLGKPRLIALIVPVVLGPILLTLSFSNVLSLSPQAVATFSIILSLLVVGHLVTMVQARASSTHWASHDKLTGLPNRALFRERTATAIERARKTGENVAVLYLDLDRFKHVNDSMGHEAGDQLLEQVARRILACVDAGDTVARIGGDEFAVLLPDVSDEGVPRKLARRLLKSFSTPFTLRPRPVFMSPSIGIAMSEHDSSLETLLTHADTAMYRAKECGRNNFAVWSQDMNEAAKQRLMLETHLHSAIQNNELRLAYQPKVDLATGNVTGVEALIRWHHPKLGVISPGAFIHLAEESGLINQIGEWVIAEACRQGRIWYESGFTKLTIAVNLSSRQFQHGGLATFVASTLRTTGFPGDLLELELTESMAMSGEDGTLSTLRDLRQMGVHFSIDDFGTGYSNLSYLSRYPIDALKIDKSFVQQIDQSNGDAALVIAIIAMGHGLGLKVIAEGVETPEQVAFLVEQRCDEMQGFLFSRPLPPTEIESLLMLEHVSGGNGRLGLSNADPRRIPAPQPVQPLAPTPVVVAAMPAPMPSAPRPQSVAPQQAQPTAPVSRSFEAPVEEDDDDEIIPWVGRHAAKPTND